MLKTRILSAVLLAPPFVACIYFGSPWFELLFAGIAVLMGWEWSRITHGGRFTVSGWIMAGSLGLLVLSFLVSLTVGGIGILGLAAVALVIVNQKNADAAWWDVVGILYLGLTLFCLVLFFRENGWQWFVWLLAIVWATDTGAYFAGRSIGGPKLAPRISPNKTWAGLGGGMILAGVAGWVMLLALGMGPGTVRFSLLPVLAAPGLAVVAQLGDLFESYLKRRFGVKDSSRIIPGHGGLLDRFDGLLAVAPLAAASTIFGLLAARLLV